MDLWLLHSRRGLVYTVRRMKTVLYIYESAFMMWRRRLAGVYAVARQEGWQVESVDVGELVRGIRPVLDYWKPDGVIVEGGVFRHRGCSVGDFADQKTVYCDADAAVVGTHYFGVRHDSAEVVRKAARELLSRGFDVYGFVHYRTRREWSVEREQIFQREMSAQGKTVVVFDSWNPPKREDSAAFGRRLDAFVMALPKPCGVLAANDEMAVHVLRAATRSGIAVPEEMSVMGIDNDALVCENTVPTLSSVAPDFLRSGKLAAGLLARCFRKSDLEPVVLSFGSAPLERRHLTRRTERVDIRAVRAVEYVRQHACDGISAADVIREMGLKVRTAEVRFREVAKRSIRDEIIAVRVARAKELLKDRRLNVNDIYHKCGYKDCRSLRAVFTKATGMSLVRWRAKH